MNFPLFLQEFFKHFASQIQIGIPGKVVNFDKQKMRADVQLIMKTQNLDGTEEQDYPVLPMIPVQMILAGGFYIRPEYEADDMVWITFSTFNIASALDGTAALESDDVFSLENASVSGGIAPNDFSAPSEFSESGLIIGSLSGNSFMNFKDDSIVFKFGGGTEEIKMSADGIEMKQGIKAGGDIEVDGDLSCQNVNADMEVTANKASVMTTLSKHMHPTAALGAPSPPVPGT